MYKDFICEKTIISKISASKDTDKKYIDDILSKSLELNTLSPDETAVLLNVTDKQILARMRETALVIKQKVYSNRIVTFAPLYTGNVCVNNCAYCGFRSDNKSIQRKILSIDEIKKETSILAGQIGHKRLIVVYGEHPDTNIDYMVRTINAIYDEKSKNGQSQIRRVSVNAAPMSVEDLRKLKDVGIGTYQVFQETYHRQTYEKVHPKNTKKNDYLWRLYSMHRAIQAGIEDVGIGALFGLYDWKFEVMGLVYHALELKNEFGIGPHTVSFPRLEPAFNTPFSQESEYKVSDDDFKKILSIIRLAVPYTGMVLTARENPEIRKQGINYGITQLDASTKIGIGAYSKNKKDQQDNCQQFLIGDTRSLQELVKELVQAGHIPSFCTAGYRCGRTGDKIQQCLCSGKEAQFCSMNAVLTFKEWVDDFANEDIKSAAEELIQKEINHIKQTMPDIYPKFAEYYERVKSGERDLYF